MKKIYVSNSNSYPCIPEEILKSSADSLAIKLKDAFSHINMADSIIDTVYGAIYGVDEIVHKYLGGTLIPEKQLRLFVDVRLQKHVMEIISSSLMIAEVESVVDVDSFQDSYGSEEEPTEE